MEVRRGFAALLCVALLGLAGCTDDESSADPGDPTSNAAPSPTATESGEPSIPPEARGSDETSAKAFTKYFFAELSKAMTNGETSRVGALSSPACQSCSSIAGRIENIYRKGGSLRTRGWIVKSSVARGAVAPNRTLYLRINQTKSDLLDENGDLVSSQASTVVPMRIILEPHEETWLVSRLDFVR